MRSGSRTHLVRDAILVDLTACRQKVAASDRLRHSSAAGSGESILSARGERQFGRPVLAIRCESSAIIIGRTDFRPFSDEPQDGKNMQRISSRADIDVIQPDCVFAVAPDSK